LSNTVEDWFVYNAWLPRDT